MFCVFCLSTLLDSWSSLDVTLISEPDTECAQCFDEDFNCERGPLNINWDLSSTDLLPRGQHSTSSAGRRPRTGKSFSPRTATASSTVRRPRTGRSLSPGTAVSSEVRSTLASLKCATRTVSVGKLAVQDAARLASVAADLETGFVRLANHVRSTYVNLRRRADDLRRRLRFHSITALGGVRRTFDGGLAEPFAEVRERSLVPLVADCYQTMSDVERTVKQLTFTSASEVVARKVRVAIYYLLTYLLTCLLVSTYSLTFLQVIDVIIIIIIIIIYIPSVVQIPRDKSKFKSKRNAGTARSRPQGLCGRKCPEWQLCCIVELPLTGVEIGRRSLACHQ